MLGPTSYQAAPPRAVFASLGGRWFADSALPSEIMSGSLRSCAETNEFEAPEQTDAEEKVERENPTCTGKKVEKK